MTVITIVVSTLTIISVTVLCYYLIFWLPDAFTDKPTITLSANDLSLNDVACSQCIGWMLTTIIIHCGAMVRV